MSQKPLSASLTRYLLLNLIYEKGKKFSACDTERFTRARPLEILPALPASPQITALRPSATQYDNCRSGLEFQWGLPAMKGRSENCSIAVVQFKVRSEPVIRFRLPAFAFSGTL